ncbi:MAG: acyl-CoA thioesterase [Amylibacter sp.]|jgi:4-hydroxybenzoyl-CoA thioesterase|nr:acyl-CoA thioesterase [Amylibacter sp.]
MPDKVHSTYQIVRFQHCDPAGIVFYPRYYEMLNLTVEQFFEEKVGISFNQMQQDLHVTVPSVRIETDFFEASYLEDRLDFQLRLDKLGRSSLAFNISCRCGDEERLKALITLVCIDFSKKKAVAWPASVRSRIESLMVI